MKTILLLLCSALSASAQLAVLLAVDAPKTHPGVLAGATTNCVVEVLFTNKAPVGYRPMTYSDLVAWEAKNWTEIHAWQAKQSAEAKPESEQMVNANTVVELIEKNLASLTNILNSTVLDKPLRDSLKTKVTTSIVDEVQTPVKPTTTTVAP